MYYRPFDRSMGFWIINEFLKQGKTTLKGTLSWRDGFLVEALMSAAFLKETGSLFQSLGPAMKKGPIFVGHSSRSQNT